MSARYPPRGTATYLKRFHVWFGGIFLGVGLVALLVAAVVFLVVRRDPELGATIWAFLGAPLGVGTAFSILGGTFMAIGTRQARKEERLRESGTTTAASIVTIEPTNSRVNRRYLWHILYTYEDMHGTTHQGNSGFLSAEDAQSYRIGEQVFSRYDPERPSESIWPGREEWPAE